MDKENAASASVYLRYTELQYLVSMLINKKIYLTNPINWDDKNDVKIMSEYKNRKNADTIYSLCLTESKQTYHHWKVFSGGKSGVCIAFHKSLFDEWCRKNKLTCRSVKYYDAKQSESMALPGNGIEVDDLPFIKYGDYSDEREVRVISRGVNEQRNVMSIGFDLSMIGAIGINPWLDEETFLAICKMISNIEEGHFLHVEKSTTLHNNKWFDNIIFASRIGGVK